VAKSWVTTVRGPRLETGARRRKTSPRITGDTGLVGAASRWRRRREVLLRLASNFFDGFYTRWVDARFPALACAKGPRLRRKARLGRWSCDSKAGGALPHRRFGKDRRRMGVSRSYPGRPRRVVTPTKRFTEAGGGQIARPRARRGARQIPGHPQGGWASGLRPNAKISCRIISDVSSRARTGNSRALRGSAVCFGGNAQAKRPLAHCLGGTARRA